MGDRLRAGADRQGRHPARRAGAGRGQPAAHAPRLEASSRRPGAGRARPRACCAAWSAGETLLVVGAIFAAGIMSSVAPPPDSLAQVGAATAEVGPAPVRETVTEGEYELEFVDRRRNRPRSPTPSRCWSSATANPVRGRRGDRARFSMLDMEMGQQNYKFNRRGPGRLRPPEPAGAGHGRPLGAGLHDHPDGREVLPDPAPRRGPMTG